jgi:hypothetical protein
MPRAKSKKVGTVAPRGPLPTIGEIKTVLEDHIATLVQSFSEFGPEDRGLVTRVGIEKAASVKHCSPEIQKEIACLNRAIELLEAVQNLNLAELAV